MCADFAAEGEDCGEVYLQDFVPVVVWELVGGVAALDAAAVQKDVYSLARGGDFGDEGGDGFLGCEVCGVDCGFAAEFFDCLFGFLVGFVALVKVVRPCRYSTWYWMLTWTRRTSAPASASAIAIA